MQVYRNSVRRKQIPPQLPARSTLFNEAVGLFGTIGACLYFYGRVYHDHFLRSFGLPGGVVPTSVQDASVDRGFDVAVKLVYLSSIMATAVLCYALYRLAKHYFTFESESLPPPQSRRATWLTRGRNKARGDDRLQRLSKWMIYMIGLPVAVFAAVSVAAIAAENTALRDVGSARKHVGRACRQCAVYTVSGKMVTGLAIAGTEDRIFILRRDGSVMSVALDDLESVRQPTS